MRNEYMAKIATAKEHDIREYERRMDDELDALDRMQTETRRLIEMEPAALVHLLRMKARETFDAVLWDCL